ncbi:DUF6894 family protein [Bradyrhizobium iriomotense]|nr:hypothetical protein [Bradyrhizobium iriomotense]
MTRFFFHAHGGISVFDDVGLELPDIEAAQAAAIELSRQILNEGPEGPFWQDSKWRVEVTDGPGICGHTFLVAQFSVTRKTNIRSSAASRSLGSRHRSHPATKREL